MSKDLRSDSLGISTGRRGTPSMMGYFLTRRGLGFGPVMFSLLLLGFKTDSRKIESFAKEEKMNLRCPPEKMKGGTVSYTYQNNEINLVGDLSLEKGDTFVGATYMGVVVRVP